MSTAPTPPPGYTILGYLRPSPAGAGATITFTYDTGEDGKGRRTGMADLAGTESYTYDAVGRTATVTRVMNQVEYLTRTTYTAFGALETLTYPDGEVVTYAYDAGGRVTSVVGAGTYVSSITYSAAGQIKDLTYGNTVVRNHTYAPTTLRLLTLQTRLGGTTFQDLEYTYSPGGNITAIMGDPAVFSVSRENPPFK